MKKKVLLSSIATIVLCLCLIAGSTYALFTSTSDVNISVTAGNVQMDAAVSITKVESVLPDDTGAIIDEFGGTYSYSYIDDTADDGFVFKNGGTAVLSDTVVALDNITPGDKVTLQITGANTSDVLIQYRYKLDYYVDAEIAAATGLEYSNNLMKGLVFTVADTVNTTYNVSDVKYMETYTSPWTALEVGDDIAPVDIVLELPVTAGNVYQNESTMIRVLVEAVQGNANVEDNTEPVLTYYNTFADAKELREVLTDPYIFELTLAEDLDATIDYPVSDKYIDAAGHDVSLKFDDNNDATRVAIKNVVIDNIVETTGGTSINVKDAKGDITIKNSTLISANGTSGMAIAIGPESDVTVIESNFSIDPTVKGYAMYYSGTSGAITFDGCTFENFTKTWVISINNAVNGDVVITGCTFKAEKGIFKALGGVNGNFTFTDNIMIGCKGDDGNGEQILVSTRNNTPITCTGTKLVSGNTLDGAAWAQ